MPWARSRTDSPRARRFALGPGLAGQHEGATAANLAVLILNVAAGSLGQTIHVDDVSDAPGSSSASMSDTIADMRAGAFGVAMVSGTNPVYSLPPASGFQEAFSEIPFKVAFATTLDETAALADLVLPAAHPLESWGDSMPGPGTYAVRQPAMRPLPMFDSRAVPDVLLDVGRRLDHDLGGPSFHEYLRAAFDRWLAENGEAAGVAGDPSALWRTALRTGSVSYNEQAPQVAALRAPETAVRFEAPGFGGDGELTLLVSPSARFGDGSHANRPWLLELPDPVSKVMWHSWVEMNPATADRMGLREGDVVSVATAEGAVEAPVWLYPGIREDAVAVPMGGGHTSYGRFANGNGVNPMRLLDAATDAGSGASALVSARATITPTGAWRRLTSPEGSSDQDDRNVTPAIARSALGRAADEGDHESEGAHGQLRELQEGGGFRTVETEGRAEDFPLPGSDFGTYGEDHPRWAMAMDLDKCTGCGACVTACQAENNIPWVGEVQATMGREMHWLRIERYYETVDASHSGPVDIRFLPMLCQHCNNAPCEPVCPVFAAYHTPDGLNAQAYNRCVGTRYCANNCPYKVRVFNWYRYTQAIPEPMNWQFNPDVTVRDNGRDGEMHLLRATDQGGGEPRGGGRARCPRRRSPHSVPERVSKRRNHLWQRQGPRFAGGRQGPRRTHLPGPRRPDQHAAGGPLSAKGHLARSGRGRALAHGNARAEAARGATQSRRTDLRGRHSRCPEGAVAAREGMVGPLRHGRGRRRRLPGILVLSDFTPASESRD